MSPTTSVTSEMDPAQSSGATNRRQSEGQVTLATGLAPCPSGTHPAGHDSNRKGPTTVPLRRTQSLPGGEMRRSAPASTKGSEESIRHLTTPSTADGGKIPMAAGAIETPEQIAAQAFFRELPFSHSPLMPIQSEIYKIIADLSNQLSGGGTVAAVEVANSPGKLTDVTHHVTGILGNLPKWRASFEKNRVMNGATNYLTSLGRDGSITSLTTFLRELIGHAAENSPLLTEERRVALSYSIMGVAVLLNCYAMARQHMKGTGNKTTRISQATNMALIGVVTAIAAQTKTLGGLAGPLLKALFYAFWRDSGNAFWTMSDARGAGGSPSLKAAFANVLPYGAVSIMVAYLQGLFYGTREAAKGPLKDAISDLIPYAFVNGLGEGLDGANFPYLMAIMENALPGRHADSTPIVPKRNMSDVVLRTEFNIPSWDEYLDKVAGAMNGRISAFVVIFGMLGVLNNVKFSKHEEHTAFLNVVVGLAIGVFCPIFVGGLSTSEPRPRVNDSPV